MIELIKKHILFGLFLSLSFTVMGGGPWTQQKGVGYFKLSQYWLTYDQYYDSEGIVNPIIQSGFYSTSLYGEYGITDRLTATLFFPFFNRATRDEVLLTITIVDPTEKDELNSIGDSDLGIKYSLTKPGAKFPVAASLILGIPSGNKRGGKLNILQTGDGEFNQLINLDAGTGFNLTNKIQSYTSLNLGFNNRTNNFSDEFRYGIEAGLGFNQKLWVIGRLYGIESLKNGDLSPPTLNPGIFANNTEFLSIGMEVAYYLRKRIGVSASMTGAFRAENIAAAPAYSVGIFYDMSK